MTTSTPKLYLCNWKTRNDRGVEVLRHLPRPGKLWMLQECIIQELLPTGKTWVYDAQRHKLKESTKVQLLPPSLATRKSRPSKKEAKKP